MYGWGVEGRKDISVKEAHHPSCAVTTQEVPSPRLSKYKLQDAQCCLTCTGLPDHINEGRSKYLGYKLKKGGVNCRGKKASTRRNVDVCCMVWGKCPVLFSDHPLPTHSSKMGWGQQAQESGQWHSQGSSSEPPPPVYHMVNFCRAQVTPCRVQCRKIKCT